MWSWVVFFIVSISLAGISWRTLFNPGSHGFYRFLAWEAMLLMLVLNGSFWFVESTALAQRVSWLLLTLSVLVLCAGVYQMRCFGQAGTERKDSALFAFERTSKLVTGGVFRFIRHPMYCSLLLLTWGIAFKHIDIFIVLLALFSSLLLWCSARCEERECLAYFGDEYRAYMVRSRMFIPLIF